MDVGIFGGMKINALSLTSNTIHRVFNDKRIRTFFTKLRWPISIALITIIIPKVNLDFFVPSISISLFGELLQLWSFSSLDKNKMLTTKGPYVFIRNPMYIGRFFVFFGFLLLIGDIWIIIIYSFLYYFYAINRIKREEMRLKILFGESYKSYCDQVNRFMPSFKCWNWKSLLFFKRHLFLQNHGYQNFMAVLFSYLLFWIFAIEKQFFG